MKRIMAGLAIVVTVGAMGLVGIWFCAGYVMSGMSLRGYITGSGEPGDAGSAIKCICEWARLAPFPTSAHNLKMTVTGSLFSRGFKAEFTASPEDIEAWLRNSVGTRETPPANPPTAAEREIGKIPRPGESYPAPAPGQPRFFPIRPGGGAQWAEVTVIQNTVSIYVYWS